jgi:voltage-gated potassium channel Kch
MIVRGVADSFWVSQYITALYFATVTMITVGYGDILPANDTEMLFCIANMILASAVFGYSINMVGQIIQEYHKTEDDIKSKMYIIKRYMYNKGVHSSI